MKMIQYTKDGAYLREDRIAELHPTYKKAYGAEPKVDGCTVVTVDGDQYASKMTTEDIVRQMHGRGEGEGK